MDNLLFAVPLGIAAVFAYMTMRGELR